VGCVPATKDYPGLCAEHGVHQAGVLRAVHRISSPGTLTWTDRTRRMSGARARSKSFGSLAERCFPVALK
jgi:hypothetical protein